MNEKHLIVIYDICLLAVCGVLAFFTTPWALLAMVFMAGWKEDTTVTVERDGATVEVTMNPDETSPAAIREAVRSAMEEVE